MTDSELDTMMCNYFMAIATHFQWDIVNFPFIGKGTHPDEIYNR